MKLSLPRRIGIIIALSLLLLTIAIKPTNAATIKFSKYGTARLKAEQAQFNRKRIDIVKQKSSALPINLTEQSMLFSLKTEEKIGRKW